MKRFLKDEDGATAVEYGLLAAMISLAIITTLQAIGPDLKSVFELIRTGFGA